MRTGALVYITLLFLCGGATLCQQPFIELVFVQDHKKFSDEQVLAPAALRKFFIPLSLIEHGVYPSVRWCDRIKKMLDGMSISQSVHYVAPVCAVLTYVEATTMASSMHLPEPLIFVTDKNHLHPSRAVEAMMLDGGFYALIFNQTGIARNTTQQLRALVAHELAQVARYRDQGRRRMLSAYGVVCGAWALALLYKYFSAEWILKHGPKVCLHVLLMILGGVVFNLSDSLLNTINDKEANAMALQAFRGTEEEFNIHLKNTELEELARAQHREFQCQAHILFLLQKIDGLAHMLNPYVICFLKNQIKAFSDARSKKSAYFNHSSFLDPQ